MNPDRFLSFLQLIGGVMQLINARRKLLTASQWLGLALLAFGILFLLEAARPAGSAGDPGLNSLAVPIQDVSRIPGFGVPVLTPPPTDLSPYALLAKSDNAMNHLQSLAEVQRLVGSSGPGATATFAYQARDRLCYQVSGGLQSIASGDTQYYVVEGQAWDKSQRASSLHWPNFTYAKDAANAKLEGLTSSMVNCAQSSALKRLTRSQLGYDPSDQPEIGPGGSMLIIADPHVPDFVARWPVVFMLNPQLVLQREFVRRRDFEPFGGFRTTQAFERLLTLRVVSGMVATLTVFDDGNSIG